MVRQLTIPASFEPGTIIRGPGGLRFRAVAASEEGTIFSPVRRGRAGEGLATFERPDVLRRRRQQVLRQQSEVRRGQVRKRSVVFKAPKVDLPDVSKVTLSPTAFALGITTTSPAVIAKKLRDISKQTGKSASQVSRERQEILDQVNALKRAEQKGEKLQLQAKDLQKDLKNLKNVQGVLSSKEFLTQADVDSFDNQVKKFKSASKFFEAAVKKSNKEIETLNRLAALGLAAAQPGRKVKAKVERKRLEKTEKELVAEFEELKRRGAKIEELEGAKRKIELAKVLKEGGVREIPKPLKESLKLAGKPTSIIFAGPTKKERIEKVEIPFAKIGKTFEEFEKTVFETGKEFEKFAPSTPKFFAPSRISALTPVSKAKLIGEFARKKFVEPKTQKEALAAIGRAVAGTGEFFETGIRGVGFLAERGVRGFGRITGEPLEFKITIPTGTAKLIRGAATVPILGEPFKVTQVSPAKGMTGASEVTLTPQTFVKAAQTAAEIELLTGFGATRFVAGKAGAITKILSRIPSKTKVGLSEVVARVKTKFPKRSQTPAEIAEEVEAGTLTLEEFKKGFFPKRPKPLTALERKELVEGLEITPKGIVAEKGLRVKAFGKTKFKEVKGELERLFPEKIGPLKEQKFKVREFDVKAKEPFTPREVREFEAFVKEKAIREGKPFVETFFKKPTPLTVLEKKELGVIIKEFEVAQRAKTVFKKFKKPTIKELIEFETGPSRKQKELIAAREQFKKIFPLAKPAERKLKISKAAAKSLQAGARRLIEAEERALVKLVGKDRARQIEQGIRTLLEKEKIELKKLIKDELGGFPRGVGGLTQFERAAQRLKQIQKRRKKPFLPQKRLFGPVEGIPEEEIFFRAPKVEKISKIEPSEKAFPILRPTKGIEAVASKKTQVVSSARKELEKFGTVSALKGVTKVSELKALKEVSLLKTGLASVSGTKVAEAVKSASAQAEQVKSASKQAQALRLKSPQRLLTRTITKQLTKTPTRPAEIKRIKTSEITKPRVPSPIPILLRDKDVRKKKRKRVPGFHAFVKEEPFKTSKFRKVSKRPRPLANVLERGFKVTDNTISQTTEARPTKVLVPPEPPPKKSLKKKFREVKVSGKKKRFIEKRGFAIDTLGEKQKLKVSAFLARERKRALGLKIRKTKGFKKSKGLQGSKRKGRF